MHDSLICMDHCYHVIIFICNFCRLSKKFLPCPVQNDTSKSCTIVKPHFGAEATAYLLKVSSNNLVGTASSAELLVKTLEYG